MQRKKQINTDIHNQITSGDSKKDCDGCWETMCIPLKKMTGTNVRAAETELSGSVLPTNRNTSTVVGGFGEKKTGTMPKNY